MPILLVAATAMVVGATMIIVSPRRTAFVLGLVVGTNASAVINARHGIPAFILPLALVAIGMGALRLLRARRIDPPHTWLPAAAIGAVAAIVLSAAIGPFIAVDASSSSSSVSRLLQHLLVLVAFATVCRREQSFRAALYGFATGGAVLATLTNLQTVTGTRGSDLLGFGSWNREVIGGSGDSLRAAGPFFDDPNAYAQYLVVLVAIATGLVLTVGRTHARHYRWFWWAAIASMVFAVGQTASRGGIVGLALLGVAVVVLDGVDARRLGVFAIAAAALLVGPFGIGSRLATLVNPPTSAAADSGLRGRASEMLAAIDMFVDHPVAGVGYGTYNDRYLDYSRDIGIDARFEDRSAHSLPLEIAAEQGLFGLAVWTAFATFAVVVVARLRRVRADLGVPLGLALLGFGATSLFLHDVHPRLMWSLLGMTVGAAFLLDRWQADTDRAAALAATGRSDRLRVAMVIQSYVPAVGGAERQLSNLVPLLVERGIEPLVVTRSMPGRPRDDIIDGIPVIRLRVRGPKLLRSIQFVVQARAVLERFDPHVVHAYDTLTPSSIALGHRARTGTPVVTKILRSGELGDLHRLGCKPFGVVRRRRLLRHTDAIVAISSEVEAELAAFGVEPDRRVYIPNGVDTGRFAAPHHRTRTASPTAPLTVVATGRIAPEKRLVELAQRWHRVTDRWPGTRLLIVGEGPEAERLRTFDDVELLGRQRNIPLILEDADIYVSASSAEGLSNSLLEAMSAGLPCAVTDVGGVRDVIRRPSQGTVVDADDLDGLIDAIVELIGNRSHRSAVRRSARRRIVHSFGLHATADQLVALYTRLVTERPHARVIAWDPEDSASSGATDEASADRRDAREEVGA